jgi:hypothetical protein
MLLAFPSLDLEFIPLGSGRWQCVIGLSEIHPTEHKPLSCIAVQPSRLLFSRQCKRPFSSLESLLFQPFGQSQQHLGVSWQAVELRNYSGIRMGIGMRCYQGAALETSEPRPVSALVMVSWSTFPTSTGVWQPWRSLDDQDRGIHREDQCNAHADGDDHIALHATECPLTLVPR